MRRREFGATAGALLLGLPRIARAQQRERPRRIALPLSREGGSPAALRRFLAFRNGLKDLGYIEGVNLLIDQRDAHGSSEDMVALCRDMVAQGAEVIVAGSTPAALAAQRATTTVPIVMRAAADPVAARLVESLARPGGNITGVTSQAADLSAKRLQILQELLPHLRRVAVLWEPTATASRESMGETEAAARALGIQIEGIGIRGPDDLTEAFRSIVMGGFDAIDVLASPLVTGNRERILDFAREARMPGIYQERPFAEAGGLISYGPNFEQLFRRLAYYVDRILRGTKPADLPVEQPTKFELVINLQTAKALGLAVPQSLLARADEVIE